MTGHLKLYLAHAPRQTPDVDPRCGRAGVSLRLFGTFELLVDGSTVRLPGTTQRLIALLALRGRSGRSRLAGELWPDTTEPRAMGCLRTAIWRVNQAAPGLVRSTAGAAELDPGADVDVRRLVETSQALLAGSPSTTDDRLSPQGGELLPDWEDDWLSADRERLRQLHLHVLEAQAECLLQQGSYGLALEWALAAVRAEPLRESAHRTVIRIHLAEGNLTEAVRSYQQCADLFMRELGMEPSGMTAALVGSRHGARDRAVTLP